MSKAHKKILNRVTRYLKTGTRRPSKPKEEESMEAAEPGEPSCSWMDDEDDEKKNDKDVAVKEVDPEKVSEASGNTDIEMKEDTEEGEATEKQQGEEGGEEPMSNDAADSRPKKKKQARVPRPGEFSNLKKRILNYNLPRPLVFFSEKWP